MKLNLAVAKGKTNHDDEADEEDEESEHDDQGDATMGGDTVGSEAASAEQRPMQLATEEQLPVLGEDSSHSDTGAQPQQQQEQQSVQDPPPLPAAEDQPNSEKDEKQEQQQGEQPGLPSSFVGHRLF